MFSSKSVNQYLVVILGLAILVAALAIAYFGQRGGEQNNNQLTSIIDFDSCAAAGFPIAESYPPQCRTSDGRSFSQDIGNELDKIDLIRITSPRPNDTIASPLLITGEARGTWYFEASFPIQLFDANDNLVSTTVAQAQSDWMTENFVPFQAQLFFSQPDTAQGYLLLKKDNPSGLPENDDQLRVPVIF